MDSPRPRQQARQGSSNCKPLTELSPGQRGKITFSFCTRNDSPFELPPTTVHNERAIGGKSSYKVNFDLGSDIKFHFPGPVGPQGVDTITSDLLDIALSVVFVERDLRKLALTNRVSSIDIKIPVREVRNWTAHR